MASLTIRNIDDQLAARLHLRAAEHGRSVQDAVRYLLCAVLSRERASQGSLAKAIRARVEPLGGVELELAARESMREPENWAR